MGAPEFVDLTVASVADIRTLQFLNATLVRKMEIPVSGPHVVTDRESSTTSRTITIGTHTIEVGDYISVHGMDDADYDSYRASNHYYCEVTGITGTTVTYTHSVSKNEVSTPETSGRAMCSKWKRLRWGYRLGCEAAGTGILQNRSLYGGISVDDGRFEENSHAVGFHSAWDGGWLVGYYGSASSYYIEDSGPVERCGRWIRDSFVGSGATEYYPGSYSAKIIGRRSHPATVFFEMTKATDLSGVLLSWATYKSWFTPRVGRSEAEFLTDLEDATALDHGWTRAHSEADQYMWENALEGPLTYMQLGFFGEIESHEVEVYDMGWKILS